MTQRNRTNTLPVGLVVCCSCSCSVWNSLPDATTVYSRLSLNTEAEYDQHRPTLLWRPWDFGDVSRFTYLQGSLP